MARYLIDANLPRWFSLWSGGDCEFVHDLGADWNDTAVASATYTLFRQAILEEKQVACVYNGHRRELCPHIIGHTGGDEKVLAFQFAGETSTTLPAGGEWRCLCLARVSDARLRDGPWHAGSEHWTTQRCVADIDLDVNVHVRRLRAEASASRVRGARSRSRRV